MYFQREREREREELEQNSDDGIIMEERTEPLRDKSPKPEPKPDDSDEKPEEEETKPKPEPEEKIEPEKDRPNWLVIGMVGLAGVVVGIWLVRKLTKSKEKES